MGQNIDKVRNVESGISIFYRLNFIFIFNLFFHAPIKISSDVNGVFPYSLLTLLFLCYHMECI